MGSPIVSVVMSVFNGQSIEGILTRLIMTSNPWLSTTESTDATPEVLSAMRARTAERRFPPRKQVTGGIAWCSNPSAMHQYIARLDADDRTRFILYAKKRERSEAHFVFRCFTVNRMKARRMFTI